ncbi:hypothetical protein OG264_34445 [Streptomyces xanthophaeus]|uniref:hypothetical protein n=1 Tax=Streptomyces xanthophaeus TaxID=67385 RepID=UPI0038705D99|nr:hypothetical protein OG264_34445 [Streptomyces xanthophaeus]WST58867.1 hypothetical protein OG605_03990 [Streptomyces xanthophaeus]
MTVRTGVWSAASWKAWATGSAAPWHGAVLDEAHRLIGEGRYEEAEARARVVVAARGGVRGRDRRPVTAWQAGFYAATAAIHHGRGAAVLGELDALIEDMEQQLSGGGRTLLLTVRLSRARVLIEEGRPAEAEAEAQDVLRALTRIAHLTEVWQPELLALACLGDALCAQERYEEAEAIARGHLPRAEKRMATALHRVLVRSLTGQGRHEEALAEACRPFPEPLPSAGGELELITAGALYALGRHGEAETEARRALAACEPYLHPQHRRFTRIHALLARIASAQA